jgi:hypothetical protein
MVGQGDTVGQIHLSIVSMVLHHKPFFTPDLPLSDSFVPLQLPPLINKKPFKTGL